MMSEIHVDRKKFLATVGVGAMAAMTPEDKAEELEHYMIDLLEGHDHAHGSHEKDELGVPCARPCEIRRPCCDEEQEQPRAPRGTGNLFQANGRVFEPMPEKPTLVDFFNLRFAPARHVLQSANYALQTGQPEETVLACLLHDVVQNLIKVDHGWWGAQLVEPYVDERVAWAIRYHAALRFYPDESVGYEYPEMYNRIFGEDYIPEAYIERDYQHARAHEWYMDARLVTLNDTYAFQDGVDVSIEPFIDIIGRHFKQPKEGLGYGGTPSSHMWRTIGNPNKPL
jgi:hypothetical protein